MISKETTFLDQIKSTAYIIWGVVDEWEFDADDYWNLDKDLEETNYNLKYGKSIGPERLSERDGLDREIRNFFLSIDDAKSQERYGRYLVNIYQNDIKFVSDLVKSKLEQVNNFGHTLDWSNWPNPSEQFLANGFPNREFISKIPKWEQRTDSQKKYFESLGVLSRLSEHLDDWLSTIEENLECFLPEILREFQQLEPTESDKGLTAPQKLLFIRLLQRSNLFPSKPNNTDDSPALRGIALITGLDYVNDIKGGKGADAKVSQLLNARSSLTKQQLPQKFSDLDAIEKVAQLMNVEPVIQSIQSIRAELEKLRDS